MVLTQLSGMHVLGWLYIYSKTLTKSASCHVSSNGILRNSSLSLKLVLASIFSWSEAGRSIQLRLLGGGKFITEQESSDRRSEALHPSKGPGAVFQTLGGTPSVNASGCESWKRYKAHLSTILTCTRRNPVSFNRVPFHFFPCRPHSAIR